MAVGKVWLVGAGPGDPGLLTVKGARAIARCDALVYDYLASEAIVDLAPPGCEKIYVGKKAGAHTVAQNEITGLIVALGLAGRRVVRLKGGDVFVFARGGEEAQALRAAGVPFEIVPGITSAIAVPAYAGIPLTYRGRNTSFSISTGHENPRTGSSSLDFAKLTNPAQTIVFLMAMANLGAIVDELRKNGMPGDKPVAIVREGTKPTQETLVATLDTIVAEVERTRFAAPAVVVVGDVVNERESIRWFDNTPLFGKRVLVTRAAAQADDVCARLVELGAEPIVAPTIAIGPPDDRLAAREAIDRVRDYAWVIFTSRNGVEAFFDRLAERGRDARAIGDANVAAIGPQTAAALAERGVRADFVPARFVNEAVADGMLERTRPGDAILLFRAQEARDVLPQALRAAGRVVADIAAYKTQTVIDAELGAKAALADILTFTSASTVTGFLANVPDAGSACAGKVIACIGPITAAAARQAGLNVTVVADEFTIDGLMRALDSAVLA